MRFAVLFILISISVLPAALYAGPPVPYFGGGIFLAAVYEDTWEPRVTDPDNPPVCGTPYIGDTYYGPGCTIEGGWMGKFWDVHALLLADFTSNRYTEWGGTRFGIGARLRASDDLPNPVKPFFGGGVSYGRVRRPNSYSPSKTSSGCFGYMGEIGLLIVTNSAFRPALSFRYERFQVKFDRGSAVLNGADELSLGLTFYGTLR